MDADSLVDRVRAVIVQVEVLLHESEDRKEYRREHGRELSEAHREALQSLQGALKGLCDRLGVLLAPDVDVAALRQEFDALTARLARMED